MTEPLVIRPGDVLLARGSSRLARQIIRLTRGPVHHAAFVLDDDTILEATTDVIAPRQTSPIPPPISVYDWTHVLAEHGVLSVYVLRYTAFLDGRASEPVLRRGRAISGEGHSYAADRLILMALYCLSSRLHINEWAGTRNYFEEALRALDDHSGATPAMVCSELVTRVFLEADPDCSYPIRLADADRSPRRRRPVDDTNGPAGDESSDGWPSAQILSFIAAQTDPDSMLGSVLMPEVTTVPGIDSSTRQAAELAGDALVHLPGLPEAARRFLDAYLARSTIAARASPLVIPGRPAVRPSPYVCGLVPAFVTPADLYFSPSFRHIGAAAPLALTT